MKYNHKIIDTGSYVEIWRYEKSINFGTANNDEIKPRKEKRKFHELSDEEQMYQLQKSVANRKRQKWNLTRLVDINFDSNTKFLTLSLKENMTDREKFNSEFAKFMKRLNYHVYQQKKMNLKYIAVLERQKRGAWHAHIILFSFPYVPHSELLRIWGLGGVRINKIHQLDDVSNVGRYVSKYMSKGLEQEIMESYGKKSFYQSTNLKKVADITFQGELTDLLELDTELAETLGNGEIIYQSDYNQKSFTREDDGVKIDNNKVTYLKIKKSAPQNKD